MRMSVACYSVALIVKSFNYKFINSVRKITIKKVMNGSPVSNISFSELNFSPIDSSVAFNFDFPLGRFLLGDCLYHS